MRAVIQRVLRAEVAVDGEVVSRIGPGILTLLGVMQGDSEQNVDRLIRKIVELRIFEDDAGKMNRSLADVGGEHLIVSQFTLAADVASGRRPSFIAAERPEKAKPLWEKAIRLSEASGIRTSAGVFQADMQVTLVNDGPVTLTLEG